MSAAKYPSLLAAADEPTAKQRAAQALAPSTAQAQADAMAPALASAGKAVAAYYQQLLAGGVPTELAERLTEGLHDQMMAMIERGADNARDARTVAAKIAGS